MNIFRKNKDFYWRNLLTRTALVVVTVAIISWFLPRNEGQQFRYDIGKPWMYGLLSPSSTFLYIKLTKPSRGKETL